MEALSVRSACTDFYRSQKFEILDVTKRIEYAAEEMDGADQRL
jgi:hypothetical protein